MPELPEVETTVRGLRPHLLNQRIECVTFHRPDLRFPLNSDWQTRLQNQTIANIERRAKFLLFSTSTELTFSWHLGMSGSLRITQKTDPRRAHDHVSIDFADSDKQLRYHDPRRFGWLSVFEHNADMQAALSDYGVEPLSDDFSGEYLYAKTRHANRAVKVAIMDQKLVVGVGNIYACEALFRAGINPKRPSKNISVLRYQRLANDIKCVLSEAINAGGTTLKDFVNPDAQPGYFKQTLAVYGRTGEPCLNCTQTIKSERIGGRNTFYCARCQR